MAAFSLLTVLLPAVLLGAAQVSATTFPTTVEVDLIFPRNDTYAPSALFPIVFAFQNAALAPSLDPGFDMTLWDITGENTTGHSILLNLATTNFSGSDPTYAYTYVANLNTTNGDTATSYRLVWAFSAGNCSNTYGPVNIGGGFLDSNMEFTIQNGAQQPDLVVATANSASCSNMSHLAFNLTSTLDVTLPAQYDNRNTCAVFSDVQPQVAGNPCAVQVSSATASSIFAALTATACAAATPIVSCESRSTASWRWSTEFVGYMVGLGVLAAAFVTI